MQGGGGEHLVAAEKLSDVSALHHKAMKPDVTFKIIQKTERDKLRLRIVIHVPLSIPHNNYNANTRSAHNDVKWHSMANVYTNT